MTANVVFISVDTMRPDHLGCYGYRRDTSPSMDALATEGARFTQAIAPHIPTAPSHTTFYTGLNVFGHKIAAHLPKTKLDPRTLMLPQILQRHGFVTGAVDNMVTLGRGLGSWFARGFDYYSGFRYEPSRMSAGKPQATTLTKRALELLKLMRREPFFLFVHYWDPHTPYRPPPCYQRLFYNGDPYDTRHTSIEPLFELSEEYYRAVLADMGMAGVTDLEYVIAQYDAEIRAVDDQVGEIMQALRRYRVDDRTLIVLVSDHGEAFGEGDLYFEHHGLYDAVVRIAAILRLPNVILPDLQIDAMIAGQDLVPTILDFVGIDAPYGLPYDLDGVSLRPLLQGGAEPPHRDLILSEATRQASYGMRTSEWKLILPVTKKPDGAAIPDQYGRPRSDTPLLYHLATDPGEREDVAEQFPDVVRDLLQRLEKGTREGLDRWGGPDPVCTQATGRGFVEAMGKLRERARPNTAEAAP